MNWYGGGLVVIINYSSLADSVGEGFEILAEDSDDLVAETEQELLLESAP